jgi:hypothetical protein
LAPQIIAAALRIVACHQHASQISCTSNSPHNQNMTLLTRCAACVWLLQDALCTGPS